MKAYYEDLWGHLPDQVTPPDLERRLAYLRAEVRPGDRALDIGCGEGTFTAALVAAGASAIGVDVAEGALRRARARHPELDFRLTPLDGPLPFTDNAFELLWASEVIEHVADTARWLSEVRRVLTPDGRLLITTPHHPRLGVALRGVEHYSDPLGDHLHLYTHRSLRELLGEFGFEQIVIRAEGGAPGMRRILVARAVRP